MIIHRDDEYEAELGLGLTEAEIRAIILRGGAPTRVPR